MKYDFSGWVTRANLKCSDGRVIMHDAFRANDGMKVPLVWNHNHSDVDRVIGNVLLENREEGVYGYGSFNDTEKAKHAKLCVQHGDINALSIFANQLQQQGNMVAHGNIREVSLVLAGANPGAFIDSVIAHGEEQPDMAIMYNDMEIHPVAGTIEDNLEHSDKPAEPKEEKKTVENKDEKTVKDVVDSMTEEQKTVMYALIGQAIEDATDKDHKEDNDEMKHNVFEGGEGRDEAILSHADQVNILTNAKAAGGRSFQTTLANYLVDNGIVDDNDDAIAHGFNEIETLFPEYKDMRPGAPEIVRDDNAWVAHVMSKVHKSPFSRIRTRKADVDAIRAGGYKTKGSQKKDMAKVNFAGRTTDPQTVYIKDKLDRDDIIDITDFDVVSYEYGIMKDALNEELATAFLIGDGREPGDEQKIEETHIRSIWNDNELYTIHTAIDIEAQKAELQGTNTGANFGTNYIYAEAIITAALYAREQYKGSGALDFYCTPHLLNIMLLAKDMNGRRIYASKTDLAAALNVSAIHTVEKFDGKIRTDSETQDKFKLLGIFVNLADYNVGSVKKGEITSFNDFDIDFNQYKYLMETRLSGALTRVKSAIVLEEPVVEGP